MLVKVTAGVLAATSATLLWFLVVEFNPFLRRCNPDACHAYTLEAFRPHSVLHAGANACEYGLLPGFLTFNVIKPPGSRWQTAVANCQLKNLLAPSAATGDVRMLLLGDSADARLAQQLCQLHDQPLQFVKTGLHGTVQGLAARASGRGRQAGTPAPDDDCCKDRDVLYFCEPGPASAGRPGSVGVGMFHLPGVHLSGPFHAGAKGSFLARVPAALKAYNATFGGPPNLVMLHSNFWDQSRMWEQRLPDYGHLNKLMPDVVFSWSSNFSLLLSTTSELLPEDTLVLTRTAAFPAFTANWLGRWQYIHQLNTAAIEVTRLHGLSVIDLGGMVFGLNPTQYLEDQHHPNKILLLEVANIALNLLQQQRKRLALERQAEAMGLGSGSSGNGVSSSDSGMGGGGGSSSSGGGSSSSDGSTAEQQQQQPTQLEEQSQQQQQQQQQQQVAVTAAPSAEDMQQAAEQRPQTGQARDSTHQQEQPLAAGPQAASSTPSQEQETHNDKQRPSAAPPQGRAPPAAAAPGQG